LTSVTEVNWTCEKSDHHVEVYLSNLIFHKCLKTLSLIFGQSLVDATLNDVWTSRTTKKNLSCAFSCFPNSIFKNLLQICCTALNFYARFSNRKKRSLSQNYYWNTKINITFKNLSHFDIKVLILDLLSATLNKDKFMINWQIFKGFLNNYL